VEKNGFGSDQEEAIQNEERAGRIELIKRKKRRRNSKIT
jgi:hypothetical protein